MMKGGIAGLMKQAQQMQDNMRKMQEQLATVEVEGQSGAGMVKVVMTCRHDVKRVTIDPSLLADDKDMLEDLIAAAVNDAVRRVESTTQEKMAGFTAGLGLPLASTFPAKLEAALRGKGYRSMWSTPGYPATPSLMDLRDSTGRSRKAPMP